MQLTTVSKIDTFKLPSGIGIFKKKSNTSLTKRAFFRRYGYDIKPTSVGGDVVWYKEGGKQQ